MHAWLHCNSPFFMVVRKSPEVNLGLTVKKNMHGCLSPWQPDVKDGCHGDKKNPTICGTQCYFSSFCWPNVIFLTKLALLEYNTASAVTSTCTQEKKREQDLHAFGRGVKRRRAQRKQDLVLSPQKIKRVTKKLMWQAKWNGEGKKR